ncbi:hypothetical protein TNCV_3813681 [Trichonephila clavipes]|nr:hypothetical protein TNCV_3813681 [Trichonephila clavipes]
MTKSVVGVAAILGYNHCNLPRHRIKVALDVSLGYRSPCSITYMAKFDLVEQWVMYSGTVVVAECMGIHEFQHLKDVALAVQCTGNAYQRSAAVKSTCKPLYQVQDQRGGAKYNSSAVSHHPTIVMLQA